MSETPCIIWRGSTTTGGYGQARRYGKLWLVHRLAWFHKYGEIPPEKVIRHLCHTPACYNVEHLALGTQVENAADAVERGTRPQPSTDRYHRYHVSEKGRETAKRQKRTEQAKARQRERDKIRRAAGHDVREVKR